MMKAKMKKAVVAIDQKKAQNKFLKSQMMMEKKMTVRMKTLQIQKQNVFLVQRKTNVFQTLKIHLKKKEKMVQMVSGVQK
jgi:hypothetical protein